MKGFKPNRVHNQIEVVGPSGQDFRIDTYKLFGQYHLETSRVIKGIRQDYKTQRYDSKEELFKMRDTALDYLKDKGIW